MKKLYSLAVGLIFLMALLLCTAAAEAPLTREAAEARLAAGGTITEEERMEILNSYFGDAIPTDVCLGEDVTVSNDGGWTRVLLSRLPYKVEFPGSMQTKTIDLKLKESWMEPAEGTVLIQENSNGWFTGEAPLSIGSDCTVYGSTPLREGVPVLILETDGYLHGYYAGAGTNSTALILGAKINYLRGISTGHLKTDLGHTFPILPWGMEWINGSISTSWEGTFSLHFDVNWDVSWWGIEVNIIDNSFEIALKDVTLELMDDTPIDGVSVPILSISQDLGYVFSVSGSVNVYVSGAGKGRTVFDTNIREEYGFDITLWGAAPFLILMTGHGITTRILTSQAAISGEKSMLLTATVLTSRE